jgi:hypothetical protein
VNSNLDVLFVIDNSPAIAPLRGRLLESYRRFMGVLETFSGGLPDLHIGVVTTDVGTRGAYDTAPGPSIGTGDGSCTSDGDRGELRRVPAIAGNFLSDIGRADGSRERNYTGSLADAFAQLADVGAAGCTYVRPLEAARRALGGNPANEGFHRAGAHLAVVVITNDDDCSFGSSSFVGTTLDRSRCTTNAGALVPTGEYVDFLKSLEPDPSKILVLGAFAPPGEPPCANVRRAPRLAELVNNFPNRSKVVSICEPDLSDLMTALTPTLKTSSGSPCFETTPLDVDPITEGLQADCASWYRYELDGAPVEELIPACRGDEPGPCWRISRDPSSCFPTSELPEFRDQRRFGLDAGALVIIECVIR